MDRQTYGRPRSLFRPPWGDFTLHSLLLFPFSSSKPSLQSSLPLRPLFLFLPTRLLGRKSEDRVVNRKDPARLQIELISAHLEGPSKNYKTA